MMYRRWLNSYFLVYFTGKGTWAQIDSFYVTQFSDSASLETCRSDLLEVDENGDMKLDRDEYAAFLQLQSGNQMSGEFESLPFRLESIYFSAACMCSIVDPTDNQCCLNGKDHIHLKTAQSVLTNPYLDFFCYNLQTGLIAEGFTITTPSPVDAPDSNPLSPPGGKFPTMHPTGVSVSISTSTSEPSNLLANAPPTKNPTAHRSNIPTLFLSTEPSDVRFPTPRDKPTLVPSGFPSGLPSAISSATPSLSSLATKAPTQTPISNPTSIVPTPVSSNFPSEIVSYSPTPKPSDYPSNGPSALNTEMPSFSPTNAPTIQPSTNPSLSQSNHALTSPPSSPNELLYNAPSTPQTALPLPLTTSPFAVQAETLCFDFQYVVRNQVGLGADAIFNENNNTVLKGLKKATRNITIDILNGTYPGASERRLLDGATPFESEHETDEHQTKPTSLYLRRFVPKGQLWEKSNSIERFGQWRRPGERRKLAYYIDEIPSTMNSVTDNPLCAGSLQNPRIMCAIVSSTVCVVLEEDEDAKEVRALMIEGLRQAVDSGDFLRRIPAEDLQMN